ncbi:phosphate acyltransferase PlsX [Flavisolibacter ginsengisoli]|jgi:glycerol-3-phosphate acyltransferase PlsX|uniref:Phosphate acyltransferase n=1 Tax=Flavisolibacter ginsengisoli DSM 18119 TaxID=1121884 RepID=A0A1M5A6C2_9BACT|nr:phosphate acyltransferase PlsX [Flavisolibacter ginsengisoli]SHF25694.1 phosphate:acyl-[acyl carrier protein] acyltransferase [Flavisolibacter ginsengisoli DSM 18119]
MKIGIDMMGGDFAPLEAIKGIQHYVEEGNAHLVLIGDEDKITPLLSEYNIPGERYTVVHAPQVIGMHEHPTRALKEKQQSSIAVGFHLLASGKMDAFISAGNTGAMLVGSLYSLKPIEGVLRPTISTIIPKENGSTGLLLDVGLNSDCKPEQLNQFAVMGTVYAQQILGIDNPRVALLNIGEEEGKGNLLAQATYPLLKENKHINFIGNVEGRDVLIDKADIIVCDGFSGNIILKLAESLFEITGRKEIHHEYFDRFNFENYGGTPVLGISKPVIIGHGISKGKAFKNMIVVAQKMIEKDVMEKLHTELIN